MTQSLESLGNSLSLDKSSIEGISPGVFAVYDAMKKKSSRIELATTTGIIKKSKKRLPQKAVYEFLALETWYELLNAYSINRNLKFRAPKPLGVSNLGTDFPEVLMEFLNGYELKRMGQLKRTTPVNIRGQKFPLPLYAACALHLGALNEIKEREGILHDDYDTRHVLFSPITNVSMGVIDVENSRAESPELVQRESERMRNLFFNQVNSDKDKPALNTWYTLGKESFSSSNIPLKLPEIIEKISKKYQIDFDFYNMSINGQCVRYSEN